MPRHASFYDIGRLDIPTVVDFGNPRFDPGIPHLQLYEQWNLGRFLYFRFDERNWLPKKAIAQYNREWPHHQLGAHLAIEAKRIFMRVRDNTQQNFFLGLADVVTSWLDATNSGQLFRQQYTTRRRRHDRALAQAVANNTARPTLEINIAKTRFPRGPGRVPNAEDQERGIVDHGPNPPPAPADNQDNNQDNNREGTASPQNDRPRLYLNRFLPFFNDYVTRPKCVKHCWKYNLEFVDEEIRNKWDVDHKYGDPEVPLFEGLTRVVEDIAPIMLIHVLQQRRQRWAESGLINLFAHTTRHTMNTPSVNMELFINAGMAGVRANRWNDLVVDEREDRIPGTTRDADMDPDPTWDAGLSW
jgi:hypothetical protein